MKTADEMKAKSLEITLGMMKDGFTVDEGLTVLAMTLAIMASRKGLTQHQIIDRFVTTVKAVEGELK